MLSPQAVAEYKNKLESEKKKILEEVRSHERPEDFGADPGEFEEKQDEVEEMSNNLAISQTLKDRVNEIDAALNRIEIGAYGLCEKCNREIGEDMLRAIPETRLCMSCKKNA
jgi:DnaK suppressor protein